MTRQLSIAKGTMLAPRYGCSQGIYLILINSIAAVSKHRTVSRRKTERNRRGNEGSEIKGARKTRGDGNSPSEEVLQG